MAYDPLYVQFLNYFNEERDYFECHEVMEELWLQEGRNPIYQALLQIAVGLYHFRNGNVNGSIKLFTGAIEKLQDRTDQPLGIDLLTLLAESRQYLDRLLTYESEPFSFYDLDIIFTDPGLRKEVEHLRACPPFKQDEG